MRQVNQQESMMKHLKNGDVATNGNQAEAWARVADRMREDTKRWRNPMAMVRMAQNEVAHFAALPADEPINE
jgi:hypothetical protein